MIRVCLSGLGRTGTEIARVILEQKGIKIVSAVCSSGSEKEGKNLKDLIGKCNSKVVINSSDYLFDIIECTRPDVAIDFSTPTAALRNAKTFAESGVNILIGTTGFSSAGINKLIGLSHKNNCGILYAPNITTGVNVLMLLTNLAASILNEYDFQITEVHHKHKKDVPSGTALKIADEIQKGLNTSGVEINADEIPINAVRAGGVVGRHEVMLVSEFDKIEISHESFSRRAFALGVIKGIKFLKGKTGYFEMSDVLNLKRVLSSYIENESSVQNRHIGYQNEFYKSKKVLI